MNYNEVKVFTYLGGDETHKVRCVVGEDGEPWFVAKDVALALGYEKPENAVARHCKASITTPKQGGGFLTIIPERDVYRLIMRSQLPSAQRFEDWRSHHPVSG